MTLSYSRKSLTIFSLLFIYSITFLGHSQPVFADEQAGSTESVQSTVFNTAKTRKKNLAEKKKLYLSGEFKDPNKRWNSIYDDVYYGLLESGSKQVFDYLVSSCMGEDFNLYKAYKGLGIDFGMSAVKSYIKGDKEQKISLKDGIKRIHKDLQNESKEIVARLPEDFQSKIRDLDDAIKQDIFQENNFDALKKLRRREEIYLAFTKQTFDVTQNDSTMDAAIEELVQSRPSHNHEALRDLVAQIRVNSVSSQPQPIRAYLQGASGTETTHFVRQMSKILGLPLCEIPLTSFNASKLFGRSSLDEAIEKDDAIVVGKIADCFRNAEYNNTVILFDDIVGLMHSENHDARQQKLRDKLNFLFHPDTTHLPLKGIGVELDIARATFIFVGKHPLSSHYDLSQVSF